MKKPMVPIVFLTTLILLSGCGDDLAPLDSTITGPEDSTFTINPPGGGSHIVRAIDFKVSNAAGVALPKVEVELLAGGGGILTDLDGNPLDPANPTYFRTRTDDRGLVRASFLITLPDCGAADLTVTGSVNATVGVASDLWTATYTISKC